jgi:hypothetical protein
MHPRYSWFPTAGSSDLAGALCSRCNCVPRKVWDGFDIKGDYVLQVPQMPASQIGVCVAAALAVWQTRYVQHGSHLMGFVL